MHRPQNNDRAKNRRQHSKAWAPYNFVPLPKEPTYAEIDQDGLPQTHDQYTQGKHTGYFAVTLDTETPLFVRGMLTVKDRSDGIESRTKPEAFSIDMKKPVIPGSSLRGMLRTLVEIVTNSKMHFVSNNKLVYRAVFGNDSLAQDYRSMVTEEIGSTHFMYPSSKLQSGYLQQGQSESGWVINPAQTFYNESFVLVDTDSIRRAAIAMGHPQITHKVFVQPQPRSTYKSQSRNGLKLELAQTSQITQSPAPHLKEATLVVSGKAPKRHWYAAIYAPDNDPTKHIPISQQMWADYEKDRDLQRGIPTRKLNKSDPLFYLLDQRGALVFFGPTMFFRTPYSKSIHGLISKNLRESNSSLDYAEALFGYVSEQNETRSPSAYAGRVSVTSAQVIEERLDYFDRTIVPKILASPKPTTFQHYLEQPEGWRTPTHQLRHYGDDTTIRGYKLYWRQMVKSLKAVEETGKRDNSNEPLTPENSSQHTRITPVRTGVSFCFRVYFENLSDVELGALVWVLTFGGDPDARHQLGMGKPFGLGVVKLKPKLVLTERPERYSRLFDDQGQWFTNETMIGEKQQAELVVAFKKKMGDFDNQLHIRELLALVRKQELNETMFSYMKIETDQGNDYDGRPVLPYPSEVGKG